ncbi:MAG: cell division protein FtsQ/DivIB [Actinomycetota bacterium]|nr:cell division protein FtsQ/DivIB [Actinomycetota bacterium]
MTDLLDAQGASGPPSQPRIDPRFARRWAEARREEGRRRLQALLVAGGVVGLALLVLGALYSPLLRVRHLRIQVTGPVAAAQVGRLAGVTAHTLMIDVHASSIAARLDADPLLGGARVVRRWPGTVEMWAVARTPLAVAATADGRWAQIDVTGRVLGVVATRPLGLPVLQGLRGIPAVGAWVAGTAGPDHSPAESPDALVDMVAASDGPDVPQGPAAVLAVLDSLPATLRAAVLTVEVQSGPGLTLVVSPPRLASGTVTVLLGDGSQLQQKTAALLTMLDQADLGGVTGLDLSVPDRPATESSSPPFPPLTPSTTVAPSGASSSSGPPGPTGPASGATPAGPSTATSGTAQSVPTVPSTSG